MPIPLDHFNTSPQNDLRCRAIPENRCLLCGGKVAYSPGSITRGDYGWSAWIQSGLDVGMVHNACLRPLPPPEEQGVKPR